MPNTSNATTELEIHSPQEPQHGRVTLEIKQVLQRIGVFLQDKAEQLRGFVATFISGSVYPFTLTRKRFINQALHLLKKKIYGGNLATTINQVRYSE